MKKNEKTMKPAIDDIIKGAKDKAEVALKVGRFIFDKVVLPKAKELADKAQKTVEGAVEDLKGSFDSNKRFASDIKAKKETFVNAGFSEKEAEELVKKIVAKNLKEAKKSANKKP